jgi:RNA recognition motif-containing protein
MGDDELRALFEPHGQVASVDVIVDRATGRSRGFGFVEMAEEAEARKAIEALTDVEAGGRTLVVNEARPREERRRRGGGRRGPE